MTIMSTFKLTLGFDDTIVTNPTIGSLLPGLAPTFHQNGNLLTINIVSGQGFTLPGSGEVLEFIFEVTGGIPDANTYALNLVNCIDENLDAITGCTASLDVVNQ